METTLEHTDERREHNGIDRSAAVQTNGSSFFSTYVRPYLGFVAAFAVGVACGVIGTHAFGADRVELPA